MNQPEAESDGLTHSAFLKSAIVFEGGLLVAAYVAGALTGIGPADQLVWSPKDFLLGILATAPMFAMLAACFWLPSRRLNDIRVFLRDTIGPLLDRCRITDLLVLALLAGVCEELLFRGFLYFWVRQWNAVLALVICNLVFGLAHAITPLYAILAGIIGLYLTALVAFDPTPNLLIPVTAHAVYDFIAFLVVVRDFRSVADQDEQSTDCN